MKTYVDNKKMMNIIKKKEKNVTLGSYPLVMNIFFREDLSFTNKQYNIEKYLEFFPGFQSAEYFKIYVLFVYIFVISILMFGAAYVLSLSTIKDSEKLSQYECGFAPFDEATRQPFDVHFYVVGILFLIFDVEIALLFPWVLALKETGWVSFITMLIFLIILTVGFFYEWHRGALIWPVDQVTEHIKKSKTTFPKKSISQSKRFLS
jgi:NADH-quinone oxidoreductase subunit A